MSQALDPGDGQVLELDDVDSWPDALHEAVAATAGDEQAMAELDSTRDRWAADGSGSVLRAYHCTRLTETERSSILREGLHVLDACLVERRVSTALEDGHIDGHLAPRLLAENLVARPGPGDRVGRVCLVGNRRDLASPPRVGWQLSVWGGEAIYMAYRSDSDETRVLTQLGTPTIVSVLIDLSVDELRCHPSIACAAAQLHWTDYGGGSSIHCMQPLGSERIEAVHEPGSEFWDRYVRHSTE